MTSGQRIRLLATQCVLSRESGFSDIKCNDFYERQFKATSDPFSIRRQTGKKITKQML